MNLKQQFLAVTEAHALVSGLSEGAISSRIYGDGNRIGRLRLGKDMLSGSIERGLQWFSDNWPEGAVWPPQVVRPLPSPEPPPKPRTSKPRALKRG